MPSEEENKPSYEEVMSADALAASLTRPKGPMAAGVIQPQAQVPTSAAAWRSARKEGFLVTLPSGQTVKIRRTLDLFERLRDGRIPNPLAGIVVDMIENKREQVDMSKLDERSLGQMLALIDETITKMMIEPQVTLEPSDAPIGWEPPEGFISTADIEIDDKLFLFNVAQGGTADLATFRAQAASFVGSVSDGNGVQDATVGSDGGAG